VFGICGTRLAVERSPLIRPRTGYVVIANHQSMLDVPLVGGLLFTNFPKYVAKKELGRWIPSISLNLRRGGNALIDRRDRHQATAAIDAMARNAQQRGVSVVIFPEGTRSREGDLGTFKRGGVTALLAAADRLPVVPAVVDGSWRLLRNDLMPVPFGTRVRIRFGDPIERRPGDEEEVAVAAERWIRRTLEEWRSAAV
jgi:1-acyl-sn-glycerol-3-phosphate acyltransferase